MKDEDHDSTGVQHRQDSLNSIQYAGTDSSKEQNVKCHPFIRQAEGHSREALSVKQAGPHWKIVSSVLKITLFKFLRIYPESTRKSVKSRVAIGLGGNGLLLLYLLKKHFDEPKNEPPSKTEMQASVQEIRNILERTVQNAQMSTSSSSSIANGWFILHFEDLEKKLEKDILYLNNTKQSISDAARQLERTIFERFGRLGDLDNGDGFRIESLSLLGPDLTDLQVTFSQLVTTRTPRRPEPPTINYHDSTNTSDSDTTLSESEGSNEARSAPQVLVLYFFTVITANDISALAAFLRTHTGHFIVGGFTLFATGAIVWDNRQGREHAVNHLDSKIDGLKKELKEDISHLKEDISRVDHKVDLTRNNVVLFGQTILNAQDGDKQQLLGVLLKIEESCNRRLLVKR
ncbi:uncharacterized protein H6S33_007298 [Morchella sextelata]|uniref:uncharacterized protein n=1 Tax=Morchella sextelata TaxID=1174677 RepID=UPI001D0396D6|nr:uncharacterized protein H6S33_007298 [Morchella sextelata]KAH0603639.1 hypothetical protein H6S33_007298 [Morchella sextelata]